VRPILTLLGSAVVWRDVPVKNPNIELVERVYGAFMTGDSETVAAAFSPAVRWSISGWGPGTGTLEGVPAVLAHLFEAGDVEDYRLEVLDMLASDERVAVLARTSGRRGDRTIVNDYVQLVRVVDGRVVEVCNYNWDQRAMAEFMAAPAR